LNNAYAENFTMQCVTTSVCDGVCVCVRVCV
jgi:hypothetical protein